MANRRPTPLRITDGATYRHNVSIYWADPDGNTTVIDYTAASVTAQLRAAKPPYPVLRTFAVINNGASDPQLQLSLLPEETFGLYDLIEAADPTFYVIERGRPGDTPIEARMDLRTDWPDGSVEYPFYARVLVYKTVTVPV